MIRQKGETEIVMRLNAISRADVKGVLASWLDGLTVAALGIALATGGMRVGVSGRLARTALADAFDKDIAEMKRFGRFLPRLMTRF